MISDLDKSFLYFVMAIVFYVLMMGSLCVIDHYVVAISVALPLLFCEFYCLFKVLDE